MGNNQAKIYLFYDIETEVKITNPLNKIRKIHRISPKKYLVVCGTNKLFPNDIFKGDYEHFIEGGMYDEFLGRMGCLPKSGKRIEELNVGDIYPIHIRYNAINFPRPGEEVKSLELKNGELEKRLKKCGRDFHEKLGSLGLNPNKSDIYSVLCC